MLRALRVKTRPAFALDRPFLLALAAAPLILLLLTLVQPEWSRGIVAGTGVFVSFVLWQPLIEELLFRGVLQGWSRGFAWGRSQFGGISVANLAVSLLFSLTHLAHHSTVWAVAVIVPSLVFGYFRDRDGNVMRAMALHMAYNGCYLLMGAIMQDCNARCVVGSQ